eukprot:7170965-Prymnesium_polylepis.1
MLELLADDVPGGEPGHAVPLLLDGRVVELAEEVKWLNSGGTSTTPPPAGISQQPRVRKEAAKEWPQVHRAGGGQMLLVEVGERRRA